MYILVITFQIKLFCTLEKNIFTLEKYILQFGEYILQSIENYDFTPQCTSVWTFAHLTSEYKVWNSFLFKPWPHLQAIEEQGGEKGKSWTKGKQWRGGNEPKVLDFFRRFAKLVCNSLASPNCCCSLSLSLLLITFTFLQNRNFGSFLRALKGRFNSNSLVSLAAVSIHVHCCQ